MTTIGSDDGSETRNQNFYARLSGFLLLWLIVTGVAGMIIISRTAGGGPFAEVARRVAAGERMYRLGLASELVETLSALLLGFTLYMTLRPVNRAVAQLAMYWRMVESIVGCVGVMFGYVKLRLYLSAGAIAPEQAQVSLDLLRQVGTAAYNIGALAFSVGSLLFYWLFYRSMYLPRWLSALGVAASVVVSVVCLGSLTFPEHSGRLQYGWALMAVAEVVTGAWLMVRGVGRAS